jgi:hypothetical protein
MKLFCDDIRRAPDGWEIARTNTKAIRLLATSPDPVVEVSIDHDICCQMENFDGKGMSFSHASNETYMPIVYYILAMSRELRPKIVHIHSANIYAGNIMVEMLKDQVDHLDRDWSFAEKYYTTEDFKDHEEWRQKYE